MNYTRTGKALPKLTQKSLIHLKRALAKVRTVVPKRRKIVKKKSFGLF